MAAGCRGSGKAPARDAAPVAAVAHDAALVSPARPAETVVLDEVEVHLRGAAETTLVARELGRELARCLVDGERVVALPRQVPAGRAPRPARMRVEVGAE